MKLPNFLICFCLFSTALTVFGQETVAEKKAKAELLTYAINLIQTNTTESLKASIPKLEDATKLFKETEERRMEGFCRFFTGQVYASLGEKRKALNYLEDALPLVDDKEIRVGALTMIASLYDDLGETQKGIGYFEKVLETEGISKISESTALLRMGAFYSSLEQHEQSINYLSKALPLFRELNNPKAEVAILKTIGEEYAALGEFEKALNCFKDALSVAEKIGYKEGRIGILNNFGLLFSSLGEYETALKYYNDGLSAARQVPTKKGEASMLVNIGRIYSTLGKNQEALDFCNRALLIFKDIDDKAGQGATLSNIGALYSFRDEKKKALEYFEQALPLRRSAGDKSGEAATLSQFGTAYADLGENQKAIDYFMKALPIIKAIKDKEAEAVTLGNLSGIFISDNPRLAVLFGKKSVNDNLQLRRAIQGLDTETQKSYLRRTQLPSHALIQLLLSQKRAEEAFQAINAVRNQQTFDVVSESERQSKPLTLTPREEKFSKLYEDAAEKVGKTAELIEKLKREFSRRLPNPQEAQLLEQLESQLKIAGDEFLTVIKQAEAEFAQPPDKDDVVREIRDLKEMQAALRNLKIQTGENCAVVYTVIGKENLTELIVTSDKATPVFTAVKGKDLNDKAKEFAEIIKIRDNQNKPKIDVTDLAKELYNIVFKPIEAELPKGTTTIMWALDHNLRYVPFNALHDGNDYLIRRKLNNVVFTRSDPERFVRLLNPVWRGTGLANSKAKKDVKNLDISYDFSELVAVESEMSGIFKQEKSKEGIIDGDVFINPNFTRTSMLLALKKKNPIVHISSHFSIKSGDLTRSFLLLGDGTAFPLFDMRKEPKLFEGVDLLTLSACNTAMDEPNSEGQEVDGFAELAQRLGAASVMATLWSVNECSTAEFMTLFYKNKVEGKMTKAEALRRAQLDLLDGKIKLADASCNTSKDAENAIPTEPKSKKTYKAYKYDPMKPFAHPYYWSPFILYGNWK